MFILDVFDCKFAARIEAKLPYFSKAVVIFRKCVAHPNISLVYLWIQVSGDISHLSCFSKQTKKKSHLSCHDVIDLVGTLQCFFLKVSCSIFLCVNFSGIVHIEQSSNFKWPLAGGL